MKSEIGANRHNTPSMSGGRAMSRRNALRHGLASTVLRESSMAHGIERIARAMVESVDSTMQYDEAYAIADSPSSR